MRDIDLELKIGDMLFIHGGIDDYDLEQLLIEQNFNSDEIESIVNEIVELVDEEVSALQESLTYTITNKLQELIDAKHNEEYPEDAPWQLHLF